MTSFNYFWIEGPENDVRQIFWIVTHSYSFSFHYLEIDVIDQKIPEINWNIFVLQPIEIHLFKRIRLLLLFYSLILFYLFTPDYILYLGYRQQLLFKVWSRLHTKSIGHVDIQKQRDPQTDHGGLTGVDIDRYHDDQEHYQPDCQNYLSQHSYPW